MGSILVPTSPSKAQPLADRLSQRYERQRLDELYGPVSGPVEASASAIPGPSQEGRTSSFFMSSANAKRTSDARMTKKPAASKKIQTFQRSNNATLASKSRTKVREYIEKITAKGDEDESHRLVESIAIGPKKLPAPDEDLHFTRLEPSSGIALRRRMIANAEVEAYLDGRYYVPISTLYAIAQAGKCDDGDFSVPLSGDWMTMGVLVKKSQVLMSKERKLDAMGRLIEEKKPLKGGEGMEQDPKESKGSREKVTGNGETKTLGSKQWYVLTLLDLSEPPNKFGGHSGANEIEMTVFQADSTWVEPGGVRKYAGGSGGAFEKLELAGVGSLICVLNPRISNVKKWKDYKSPWSKPDTEKVRDTSMIFRLKPRTGDTIQIIGMARDFGRCEVTDCEAFVDKRADAGVCETHFLSQMNRVRNGRSQLQNSWRPNASQYSSPYSLSDGMAMGSKAKAYVMDSHNDRFKEEGGQLYDVSSHYGRARERRVVDAGQIEQLLSLKKKLSQSSTSKNAIVKVAASTEATSESRLAALALKQNEARTKGLAASTNMAERMKHVMYESAGTHVINAARMAMEKSGRLIQANQPTLTKRPLDSQGDGEEDVKLHGKNGRQKSLSQSSDRLLARHSINRSLLPKPILHRKKAKLAPAVRPPPGESFYASESSDEELDAIMQGEEIERHLQSQSQSQAGGGEVISGAASHSDSDSDLEIMPRSM